MTINSKSNAETDGLAQEKDCYCPVILGVGAWRCRLLDKISQDENATKFHTLVALDSNPDHLETSGATVKIHLDANMLIAVNQGLKCEAGYYPKVFGEFRQHFATADLIFVLVDTYENLLENFLHCVNILLNKKAISRYTVTIALLSNTIPSKGLAYSNSTHVTNLWRPDAYIDLNKTERYRYAKSNPCNLDSGGLLQSYVDDTIDIIRSISDPVLHKGLICIDFADVYSIFSSRDEVYFAKGTSSGTGRANQAAVMACRLIKDRKKADCAFATIRAAEMNISEFNKVGDVIHALIGEETFLKIATYTDDSLGDEMQVLAFVAYKAVLL